MVRWSIVKNTLGCIYTQVQMRVFAFWEMSCVCLFVAFSLRLPRLLSGYVHASLFVQIKTHSFRLTWMLELHDVSQVWKDAHQMVKVAASEWLLSAPPVDCYFGEIEDQSVLSWGSYQGQEFSYSRSTISHQTFDSQKKDGDTSANIVGSLLVIILTDVIWCDCVWVRTWVTHPLKCVVRCNIICFVGQHS